MTDRNLPSRSPEHFPDSAAHLLSAFDCYKNGDKKDAMKHVEMAFGSEDAPALFRHLQDHEYEGWSKASEKGRPEHMAMAGYIDDPNDSLYGTSFIQNGVESVIGNDDGVINTDDVENPPEAGKVYTTKADVEVEPVGFVELPLDPDAVSADAGEGEGEDPEDDTPSYADVFRGSGAVLALPYNQ